MTDGKTILMAAVALMTAMPAPQAAEAGDAIDLCDFKPAFVEDFQTLSVAPRVLGAARWTAHTPWNGDFGDAVFTDPGPVGPFVVKDGQLSITARRGTDGRWRSGLIAAADASGRGTGVQYGYFEARMRLPPGPGTWPAFWLASLKPAKDLSPGVEIDVIEYYGHADAAYSSALHVWYKGADKSRSRHTVHKTPVDPGSLVAGFHDYGVRVAADTITYYLDRKPVWRQPTPAELKTPLFPLVNLALGSGFPIDKTPNPSTLEVKYVHLYVDDPQGRDSRCPAGTAPPQ
ncbi:MAG: glycoside hydrolase family 16 protein [Ancalomicrobiaceae bacterium]|nr:glycoside hydrolase family 16 protein [Ancalomicrobiaceae bacterium]